MIKLTLWIAGISINVGLVWGIARNMTPEIAAILIVGVLFISGLIVVAAGLIIMARINHRDRHDERVANHHAQRGRRNDAQPPVVVIYGGQQRKLDRPNFRMIGEEIDR